MDLKESVENIKQWAQKHPYIAGAIFIGVILFAWYLARKSGEDGDGQISQPEQVDYSGLGLGAGAGGGFSGGAISGGLAGMLGESASPTPTPSPIENFPTITPPKMQEGLEMEAPPALGLQPWVEMPKLLEEIPAFPSSTPSEILTGPKKEIPATTPAPGGVLTGPKKKPKKKKKFLGAESTITGELTAGNSTNTQTTRGAEKIGVATNISGLTPSSSSSSGGGRGSTPAMAVGKGRKFTGFHAGTWYVNGYPVGYNSSPAPSPSGVSSVYVPPPTPFSQVSFMLGNLIPPPPTSTNYWGGYGVSTNISGLQGSASQTTVYTPSSIGVSSSVGSSSGLGGLKKK